MGYLFNLQQDMLHPRTSLQRLHKSPPEAPHSHQRAPLVNPQQGPISHQNKHPHPTSPHLSLPITASLITRGRNLHGAPSRRRPGLLAARRRAGRPDKPRPSKCDKAAREIAGSVLAAASTQRLGGISKSMSYKALLPSARAPLFAFRGARKRRKR